MVFYPENRLKNKIGFSELVDRQSNLGKMTIPPKNIFGKIYNDRFFDLFHLPDLLLNRE